MKSKLLWIFVLILCGNNLLVSQAPLWQWAKEAYSSGPERAWDITYDAFSGDTYVGGSFNGNLSSPYGVSFTTSYGQDDGFLAKYDPTGAVLWAFKIGGADIDIVKGVATDPSGNVYVAGYFRSVCDFDPSASTYTLVPFGGAGFQDGFLAKYDGSGNFIWATRFGNILAEDVWALSADANGVYFTGNYYGPVTFNSASPSVVTKTTTANQGFAEFYGAKYNSSGVVQWVVTAGSQKDDFGYSVVADNNSVYFIGVYNKDMNLYEAAGTYTGQLLVATNNNASIFIIAYAQSTGTLSWATNVGSNNNNDSGNGITQDNTYLYIAGAYRGTANFPIASPLFTKTSSGNNDLFLAQLSKTTGTFQWVSPQTCTGTGDEIGLDMDLLEGGDIYVSGYYTSPITFTAGPVTFSTSGNEDILVSSYSTSGNFLWATTAGANGTDMPHGVASTTTGGVYIAGEHANATVFGTTTLTSAASTNIFVAKTGCETASNNTIAASQTICAGNAPSSLPGSLPVGGTFLYMWEQSTNDLTWVAAASTSTNQNYSPPPLLVTTYYRRKVVAGAACANAIVSNTVSIIANPPPSTANVGANQTLCVSSATAVLSGNVPAVGTGSWSVVSGTATIAAPGVATSTVNSVATGTNILKWTISSGVCPVSSATLSIRVDNLPSTPIAGGGQTLCISSPTLLLTGNAPSVGTGSWTVASGSGSLASASSATTNVTNLGLGIDQLVWTISNGVCVPLTSTKTIQVDNLPTTATVATNQTLCISSPTTLLTGNSPTVGSGLWNIVSGTANIVTPTLAASPVNSLAVGTTVLKWKISNGFCAASSITLSIQVDNLPSTPTTGLSPTLCISSPSTLLTGNLPSVGTGSWTMASGSGSISAPSSATTNATALGLGVNKFVWTIRNGVCTALTSTETIYVDNLPSTATVTGSQTLCINVPTTAVNGNTPTVGVGLWTVQSGVASLTTPSLAACNVTALGAGNTVLKWSISNGVCATSSASLGIHVDNLPSLAFGGTDQYICSSTSAFTGTAPTVGTGSWSLTSGAATITTLNSAISGLSGISTGTNTFVWTVSNGVCPTSTDAVKIVRDALPDTSFAGTPQTICISSPTTVLAGNTPSVGIGTWSLQSGNAFILAPTQPSSGVINLTVGNNILSWNIGNGVCPINTSTVLIQVDNVPTSPSVSSNQTVCINTPSAQVSGNVPLTGSGAWSIAAGNGSLNSTTAAVIIITGLGTGTTVLDWIISNGVCSSLMSSVTIQVDALPDSAFAGANQTLCISSGSVVLNANSPLIGSGAWSFLSGSGTIANASSPSSSVTNLSAGNDVLQWEISNGVCPSKFSTVAIQVDNLPSGSFAGNDSALCVSDFTLAAVAPALGTGQWAVNQGTAVVSLLNSATSPVTGLSSGPNKFVWTISNGSCSPSVDTLIIFRETLPSPAFAGRDSLLCSTTTTLQASAPLVGTGAWQLYAGSGVITNPGNFFTQVSGLQAGANTFVWKIIHGSCPPSTDTVIIKIDAEPSTAMAGNDQRVCSTSATLSANLPSIGTSFWTVISGVAVISDSVLSMAIVTLPDTGLCLLRWTIKNGICPETQDDVTIRNDPDPGQADAGSDQQVETPVAHLSAKSPTSGIGYWQVILGSAILDDPQKPVTTAESLSSGDNIFRWVIKDGVCPIHTDDIIIYLEPLKIPNGFSPNGDGINDTYVIPGVDYYDHADFSVFNRWGGLVYHNGSYKNNWAGANQSSEPLADDTYYYTLKISEAMDYKGYIVLKTTK